MSDVSKRRIARGQRVTFYALGVMLAGTNTFMVAHHMSWRAHEAEVQAMRSQERQALAVIVQQNEGLRGLVEGAWCRM